MLPLLTNSSISAYRRCPREYRLSYVDLVRPVEEARALRFGRRWHAALEAWWLADAHIPGQQLTRLDYALMAVRNTDEGDPYENATLEVLLTGYHHRWAGEVWGTVLVEHPFRAQLVNPETGHASQTYELGGKVDGIVAEPVPGTRVLLLEHKTTSDDISPGSDYWRRLRIDSQVSMYVTGARALGYDVEGCLYDVVRKPTIRPLPANTKRSAPEPPEEWKARLAEHVADKPDQYFQRLEVVRLERDQEEAAHDVWQVAKAIRESERTNRWPRNSDACFRGKGLGAPCPFFDVCTGAASVDDPMRFRRARTAHEELTDTIPAPAMGASEGEV